MLNTHRVALIGATIDRIAALSVDLSGCTALVMAAGTYEPMFASLRDMTDVGAVLLDLPPPPQSHRFVDAFLAAGAQPRDLPVLCLSDRGDPVQDRLAQSEVTVLERSTPNGEIITRLLGAVKRPEDPDIPSLVPAMSHLFRALRHHHQDLTDLFGAFFESDVLWPVMVELAFIGQPRTIPLSQLALALHSPDLDIFRAVTKLEEHGLVETRRVAKGRRRIEVGISRLGAVRMRDYMARYSRHFDALADLPEGAGGA